MAPLRVTTSDMATSPHRHIAQAPIRDADHRDTSACGVLCDDALDLGWVTVEAARDV
jgi:hypothetical protein